MKFFPVLFTMFAAASFAQTPPIDPGVSHDLAIWRAAHYSDVRYKLNLTLEKMSPVLKGTIEIKVKVGAGTLLSPSTQSGEVPAIILDWRKIKGYEDRSTVSNVFVNGKPAPISRLSPRGDTSVPAPVEESNEHLIFRDGVVIGENVVKLDFTSPILTSGSAITRYVDKEDGAEYIYSLFVPSDASTAFPVFDQPDLKARFKLVLSYWSGWTTVSNTPRRGYVQSGSGAIAEFEETTPISTYVFAFAAGPWEQMTTAAPPATATGLKERNVLPLIKEIYTREQVPTDGFRSSIYVRRSQLAKFQPHGAEVFRLNREAVKYLETYFDYKFPWPKYDLVLIPEFPFGGMEHAGATFLRESSVIFPSEPTKGDYISRANLIFHETAHQWFGDMVTMKWFDDLWLKEGFAEFMAYKTLEKVMPESNAWKVFYERNKQAAYQTDSTKGTTSIYQPIANLSAAKSAYGNIVYRKAPSFLRQAEFYIGDIDFRDAIRSFLRKNAFKNAEWKDLVVAFEKASKKDLKAWAAIWVTRRGLPVVRVDYTGGKIFAMTNIGCIVSTYLSATFQSIPDPDTFWQQRSRVLIDFEVPVLDGKKENRTTIDSVELAISLYTTAYIDQPSDVHFIFPNYQDYGYGIFLLDARSREHIINNIQSEKDPFMRSMMWGALWDSVREAELDPKVYVELVIRGLGSDARSPGFSRPAASKKPPEDGTPSESDETIIASILGRVGTAMNYYLSENERAAIAPRLEAALLDRMQNSPTLGGRITFYRAYLNIASTDAARMALNDILSGKLPIEGVNCRGGICAAKEPTAAPVPRNSDPDRPYVGGGTSVPLYVLKTKDKFDIVTRLATLGDPEAPRLLEELEKTELSDDAKRYAYAARAAFPLKEVKEKFWTDFVGNKEISESWIEAAMGPFNSIRHDDLSLPYLQQALAELPNLKRDRKIFFVNGWLAAFIGGQKSEQALVIVNKFLDDNPGLDRDLRLKILENADIIERAVNIRAKFTKN